MAALTMLAGCALSGTACKTTCGSNADCATGALFCNNPGDAMCLSTKPKGALCGAGTDCTSGFCVRDTIAGGAGIRLGWSVVSPGDRTRLASLQAAGRDAVVLVSGATAMLLMAAAIEGFWSASSMPAVVKRGVGVFFFLVVAAFLGFVGRDGRDREPAR